tara:strand:+ start:3502 stop:4401 length:900 start_codon:yes stop_codon:yes gene_type:complete
MKNITTFKTELPEIGVLERQLIASPALLYTECAETQFRTFGFAKESSLVKLENGYRIDFVYEQKDIPSSAINNEVQKIIKSIENIEDRTPMKKERTAIKEDVMMELCHRALTKIARFSAFYHTERQVLLIDSSNKDHASALMNCLTRLQGSIKTTTLHVCGVSNSVGTAALDSIRSNSELMIAGFYFGEKLNLQSIEDKSQTIKFSTDYNLAHVEELLCSNYIVKSLSLSKGGLTFMLTDDFKIKSIKDSGDMFDPEDFDNTLEFELHKQTVILELMSSNIDDLVEYFDKIEKAAEKAE